ARPLARPCRHHRRPPNQGQCRRGIVVVVGEERGQYEFCVVPAVQPGPNIRAFTPVFDVLCSRSRSKGHGVWVPAFAGTTPSDAFEHRSKGINMDATALRTMQAPLKERYKGDPQSA